MEGPGPGSNEKTRTDRNQYEERGGEEEGKRGEKEEEERSSVAGVSLCDSAPLLFRAADLRSVRELGVVGTLVGSLPRQPRQNNRLGRPLLLLHEEARLLGELGRAVALPTGREGGEEEEEEVKRRRSVERYEEQQESSYEEQSVLALEDRKKTSLLTDRRQRGGGSGGQQAVEERLRSLEQSFTFPRSAMSVQLNTARTGLDYRPDDRDYLKTCRPAAADQMSETRYQVFRDLRARGFFLTPAGKFGGDFLVYPGDPLLFHSHYIAVCVQLDERVSLCDILSVARLGSSVKKTVLLCSPRPEDEDGQARVLYTSLQWSGMV